MYSLKNRDFIRSTAIYDAISTDLYFGQKRVMSQFDIVQFKYSNFWREKCIAMQTNAVGDYACAGCACWATKYNNLHYSSHSTKRSLENRVEFLKNQVKSLTNKLEQLEHDKWERDNEKWIVDSEYCEPEMLNIEFFESYYEKMLEKYPLLQQMVVFFFSNYGVAKKHSKKTPEEWHSARALYKAFIVDTLLKSRNSKAVLRTHLMLGVILMQYNIPEPAWRLLQRICVLSSRKTIERYLRNQPEPTISDDSFVFASMDNLEIKLKTDHMRTTNRTQMMKLLSRFILKIPRTLTITSGQIFKPYNTEEAIKFARFLVPDYSKCINIANNAVTIITKAFHYQGLKFALKEQNSQLPNVKIFVLEPDFDKGTASYDDMLSALRKLYAEHVQYTACGFAMVNGDEQTFSRMWHIKLMHPEEFAWLIPVPGEWHWNLHILRGIFKVWGGYILSPIAKRLSYKKYKVEVPNFHNAEDFLEIVTFGIGLLMKELQEFHPTKTPIGVMHHYKQYSPIYEVLYLFNWYLCPYWHTRAALKSGNPALLNEMWRYWLGLFITAKKTRYCILTMRFLWLIRHLHPSLAKIFNDFRTFSFSGNPNTGIPIDGLNELV